MAVKRRNKKGKKNRTHVRDDPEKFSEIPHSFVLHRGRLGRGMNTLLGEVRRVMEPYTARNLRARRSNVLKDFVHVATQMSISHFVIFTQTAFSGNMRIARLPHGPTLSFHVREYSLVHDVVKTQRHHIETPHTFPSAPLLVLNNFGDESSKHLKLMAVTLQNLFPSINVREVRLTDVSRCVLFDYDAETGIIYFRHYAVTIKALGMSKGIKMLVNSKIPNLRNYSDISDFVMKAACGGNISSDSDAEDALDGEVTLAQTISQSRGTDKAAQSAVKLRELGPRMSLSLIKIESGMGGGDVLYHSYLKKSKEEVDELKKRRANAKQLRDERRKQQKININKKASEQQAHRDACKSGTDVKYGKLPLNNDGDGEGSGEDDDTAYYRDEVGHEPDQDLLLPDGKTIKSNGNRGRKRSFSSTQYGGGDSKRSKSSSSSTGKNRGYHSSSNSRGGSRGGRGGSSSTRGHRKRGHH